MTHISTIKEILIGKLRNGSAMTPQEWAKLFNNAGIERKAELEKLGPKKRIRYDLHGAYQAGTGALHPQHDVEARGMVVVSYEGHPIADCIDMEVHGVSDELPDYIKILQ